MDIGVSVMGWGSGLSSGEGKLYTSESCALAILAVYRAQQVRQSTYHVTIARRSIFLSGVWRRWTLQPRGIRAVNMPSCEKLVDIKGV